ncbi:MAG: alginate O-acetyltransferase AlgX-related protein [Syntrophobacteraceae bacterium]
MKRLLIIPFALFLTAVWAPAIQMHFKIYDEFEDSDKRILASPPEWRGADISKFAVECEAYIDDHFGFRTDLIRWNILMRVHLFGVAPVQSVIVGKDTWLFYRSEALNDGESINDFMGLIPLSDAALERLRVKLEENNRKFAEKGINYIVAIAPNKNTIYSEYLPERIRKNRSRTRLEQFCDYMDQHSTLKVLDLSKPLTKEKSKLPLYWATDSHWNSFGAYVGYREIMKRISGYYPNTGVIELDGHLGVERRANGGDLARILFIQDVWPEKNDTVFQVELKRTSPQLNKLVFRHDSFGDGLYPYLKKHFKNITSEAPFAPFRFDEILRERPQIVLHLFAERYLTQAVHDDFFYKEPGY